MDRQTKKILQFYCTLGVDNNPDLRKNLQDWETALELEEEILPLFLQTVAQDYNFTNLLAILQKIQQNPKKKALVNRFQAKQRSFFLEDWKSFTNAQNTKVFISRWNNLCQANPTPTTTFIDDELSFMNTYYTRMNNLTNKMKRNLSTLQELKEELNSSISSFIKKAYFRKAREYHPDRGGIDGFNDVVMAYEILKDSQKRLIYNQTANHELWMALYDEEDGEKVQTDHIRDKLRSARRIHIKEEKQFLITSGIPKRVSGLRFKVSKRSKGENIFSFPSVDTTPTPEPTNIIIQLEWNAINMITQYNIIGAAGSEESLQLGTTTSPACQIKGLEPSTSYSFNISASNRNGKGEESTPICCTISKDGKTAINPFSKESRHSFQDLQRQEAREQKKKARKGKKEKSEKKRKILFSLSPREAQAKARLDDAITLRKYFRSQRNQNERIVKLLDRDPSLLNFSCVGVDAPLLFLCRNACIEELVDFLDLVKAYDINWDVRDSNYHRNPLMWALVLEDNEFIKYLLNEKSNEWQGNETDANGNSLLHFAVSTEDIQITHSIMKSYPEIHINHLNKDYESALLIASRNGRENAVSFLLEKGALLDTESNVNANHISPIFAALYEDHFEIVKYLLEKLIEGEMCSATRESMLDSLLHLAVLKEREDILSMLIDAGANINIQDANGDSPLHISYELNLGSLVDLLLSMGANQTLSNWDGKVPKALEEEEEEEEEEGEEEKEEEAVLVPPPVSLSPEEEREKKEGLFAKKLIVLLRLYEQRIIDGRSALGYCTDLELSFSPLCIDTVVLERFSEEQKEWYGSMRKCGVGAISKKVKRVEYVDYEIDYSSLETLPTEVLVMVIDYLTFQDLLCLLQVNKRFQNLIDDNRLWERKVMQNFPLQYLLYFPTRSFDWKLELIRLCKYASWDKAQLHFDKQITNISAINLHHN